MVSWEGCSSVVGVARALHVNCNRVCGTFRGSELVSSILVHETHYHAEERKGRQYQCCFLSFRHERALKFETITFV